MPRNYSKLPCTGFGVEPSASQRLAKGVWILPNIRPPPAFVRVPTLSHTHNKHAGKNSLLSQTFFLSGELKRKSSRTFPLVLLLMFSGTVEPLPPLSEERGSTALMPCGSARHPGRPESVGPKHEDVPVGDGGVK